MKKQQFRAQSLVEFALILPIALFLLFGFFDIGRAIFNFASLTTAVREATRFAIVNPAALNNTGDIITKVYDYSFGIPPSSIEVTVTINTIKDPTGTVDIRDNISITATYDFVPITPGIKQILGDGNGIPITAQSTMRIEPLARDD